VVHLGDNVARTLGLDLLEPLVALHLDPPGPMGQVDRKRQLGLERLRPAEREQTRPVLPGLLEAH
jgi:hypothetical protein